MRSDFFKRKRTYDEGWQHTPHHPQRCSFGKKKDDVKKTQHEKKRSYLVRKLLQSGSQGSELAGRQILICEERHPVMRYWVGGCAARLFI